MFYQETKGEYMARKINIMNHFVIDINFSFRKNRKLPNFSFSP